MIALLLTLAGPARALTMDEAWRLAETQGVDAALIEGQNKAASTIRGQALAALLPKVSATGGYTVNQYESTLDFSALLPADLQALAGDSEPIVINMKSYWSGSATVVQPLFSGSALPAWGAANNTARAARAQADASLDQLRVGVAQAYWATWFSRERVRLASDGVDRAAQYLTMSEARQQVGAGRAIDTAQAGVALARARRELAGAQAAQVEAEQGFARLLGVEPDVALERPTVSAPAFSSPEDAANQALSAPAVRAADERAEAARRVSLATDLGWVPSINGRFTEAYSQNAGFSGEELNWQAAVTADWPLFDGGYRIAKEREAAANQHLAALNATRQRDVAQAEAHTLWAQMAAAQEARTQAAEEQRLAARALSLAEASFELGAITFLDLWQTRQQRDGAELALMAAEMQLDLTGLTLRARTATW